MVVALFLLYINKIIVLNCYYCIGKELLIGRLHNTEKIY